MRLGDSSQLKYGGPNMMMIMRAEIYDGPDRLGEVGLSEKTFSTGSRGFYASAKLEIHGKRYQANFQLVEIGSKPGSK